MFEPFDDVPAETLFDRLADSTIGSKGECRVLSNSSTYFSCAELW